MHVLAKNIVKFLEINSHTKFEREEWCVYALEKNLYKFTYFSIILIIGFVINAFWETAIALCSINLLRTKISGWHADSPIMCGLLTITINCGIGFIAITIKNEQVLYLFALSILINILLCIFIEPIDNKKLHLTKEELTLNKRTGFYRTVLLITLSAFFLIFNLNSFAIATQLGIFVALTSTYIK